ncbi:MAG: hypothetical protein AMXMBFR85_05160 [Dehalococcoides mccartyi]
MYCRNTVTERRIEAGHILESQGLWLNNGEEFKNIKGLRNAGKTGDLPHLLTGRSQTPYETSG